MVAVQSASRTSGVAVGLLLSVTGADCGASATFDCSFLRGRGCGGTFKPFRSTCQEHVGQNDQRGGEHYCCPVAYRCPKSGRGTHNRKNFVNRPIRVEPCFRFAGKKINDAFAAATMWRADRVPEDRNPGAPAEDGAALGDSRGRLGFRLTALPSSRNAFGNTLSSLTGGLFYRDHVPIFLIRHGGEILAILEVFLRNGRVSAVDFFRFFRQRRIGTLRAAS